MWMSEKGCGDTIEDVWQMNYVDSAGAKVLKKN